MSSPCSLEIPAQWCRAAACSTRSGRRAGTDRRRRSTCTSRLCAESSATPAGSRRSGRGLPPAHVRSRILVGYLGLVVVVLAALEIPLGVQFGRNEQRTLETKVEHDATTIASIAPDTLRRPTRRRLQAIAGIAYRYRRDTGGRVVIVNRKGVALIDTNAQGSGVTSFASRPEIVSALRGNVASGTRDSRTLHTRLLYVAVPVAANGRIEGAARITYPTSAVDSRIRRYRLVLAAIAAIVVAVAVVVGLAVATFIARPLRRLEAAAAAVGAGDLTARAPEHEGPPEVRSLAAVFNETVAKLDQLLRSQEEFVADASHQLRTPLTALSLRLENLARDVAPPGRAELDGAVAEVARLGSMVEALLALARADTGREPAGPVDIGPRGARAHRRLGRSRRRARGRSVNGRCSRRGRAHRGGAPAASARQPARERAGGLAARVHDHGRGAVVAVVDRAANQGRGTGARARRARACIRPLLAKPQRRGQRARAGDRSPPRRAGRRERSSCSTRRATGSRRSSGSGGPDAARNLCASRRNLCTCLARPWVAPAYTCGHGRTAEPQAVTPAVTPAITPGSLCSRRRPRRHVANRRRGRHRPHAARTCERRNPVVQQAPVAQQQPAPASWEESD